jgi:hemerythrin superfamily protein
MASIHHPQLTDDPVQALLRDHDMIRTLADKYLNSRSADVKREAATQLVQAIHTHSRLEEGVFYPGLRKIEPNLVAHFEEEHLNVDDMLAALDTMRFEEPRARKMLREMIGAVLAHMTEEEEEFFPLLKLANLDLSAIGFEMAVFEANLVHMQAQFGGRGVRH